MGNFTYRENELYHYGIKGMKWKDHEYVEEYQPVGLGRPNGLRPSAINGGVRAQIRSAGTIPRPTGPAARPSSAGNNNQLRSKWVTTKPASPKKKLSNPEERKGKTGRKRKDGGKKVDVKKGKKLSKKKVSKPFTNEHASRKLASTNPAKTVKTPVNGHTSGQVVNTAKPVKTIPQDRFGPGRKRNDTGKTVEVRKRQPTNATLVKPVSSIKNSNQASFTQAKKGEAFTKKQLGKVGNKAVSGLSKKPSFKVKSWIGKQKNKVNSVLNKTISNITGTINREKEWRNEAKRQVGNIKKQTIKTAQSAKKAGEGLVKDKIRDVRDTVTFKKKKPTTFFEKAKQKLAKYNSEGQRNLRQFNYEKKKLAKTISNAKQKLFGYRKKSG